MTSEIPNGLSNSEWRSVVNDVAEELLAQSSWMAIPQHPVCERLKEYGALPGFALEKAEFYAPARVAAYILANEVVTGEGTAAHFDHKVLAAKQDTFDETLSSHVNKALYVIFPWQRKRITRFDDFDRAAFRHPYHDIRRPAIRMGGDLSYELTEFGILTRNLLQRHEQTKRADREERIAIAHELAAIIPGRATVNIGATYHLPHLSYYRDVADMRVVGDKHQLLDGRNGRPLPSAHSKGKDIGPTFKCPAHWNGVLDTLVAAGVNLLGDLGCYD